MAKELTLETRLRRAIRSRNHSEEWIGEAKSLLQEALSALEHQSPSVAEAGKRGGEAVREMYGEEFFREVGSRGGSATKEKYGSEFYRENGAKGAAKIREKYGPNYFSEIGSRPRKKRKQQPPAELPQAVNE